MQSIVITEPSDVATARRAASAAARDMGFGDVDEGRVALVATELAGNMMRHGGGGEFLLQVSDDGTPGIALMALDRGRGMADIAACLRDGYSTAGTPGTGLGAIQRQSEAFDIHSAPGLGTAVLARLRRGRAADGAKPGAVHCAAVNLPLRGEVACGDAWAFAATAGVVSLFVADGLGHGPLAATAAQEAVRLFRRTPFEVPETLLQTVHAALRPTRGAAVAVARLDLAARQVVFGGIGNIAGVVVCEGTSKRMVSMAGTAGHVAPRVRAFAYPATGAFLLILCSDGLQTSWSVDRYAGIGGRDPLLVAGLLYRDHYRGRDDVTVAVVKGAVA